MKLYDVVIVEDATNKVVSIIGTSLNERNMEKRIETGVLRCNMEKYHVMKVEAGSAVVGQDADLLWVQEKIS